MHMIVLIFLIVTAGMAQKPPGTHRTIAFYNLENLFDTIDDGETYDEDFTREGRNQYSAADYRRKISALAQVIAQIGSTDQMGSTDRTGRKQTGKQMRSGPHLIGVSEIENRQVLEDLVSHPAIDSLSYGIIHENSPDRRGIDVALLYRDDHFYPLSYQAVEVFIHDDSGRRIFTRDVLWVHGIMDGEELHFLVNHWPSRRGGVSNSAPKRMQAAKVNHQVIRKIKATDSEAKIMILGDFNDDPTDKSLREGLSSREYSELGPEDFFNPMVEMFKRGWNTLVYRDQIHLFDQILVSYSLVHPANRDGFRLFRASIYNPEKLLVREGKYRGYPFRSFQNGKFSGGYSDHFPVFIELIKP
jgi:predicted extracellular nuclease